ncbi:MAG: Rid family hydrolase [Bacteroidales bacterium]|nr:Rid family hydrolase [Bacteroidales bacterium]
MASPISSRDKYYILRVSSSSLSAQEQFNEILSQIRVLNQMSRLSSSSIVFVRLFISDVANQLQYLPEDQPDYALSIIGQAPLDGTKVAALVYIMQGVTVNRVTDNTVAVTDGGVTHYWTTQVQFSGQNSHEQTVSIFNDYIAGLQSCNMSLLNNCIRTWFFVHDVDHNYLGVVNGRNEKFAEQGLSTDTHFIASTGIGGEPTLPSSLVQMDAYAVDGVPSSDVHYLYAKSHLNCTAEYGVSFERGTYVDYPDSRRVFISGTASIDNRGRVLYEGDIIAQTERALENIEVLLAEAQTDFSNVQYLLVYLRDVADYAIVKEQLIKRFNDTIPFVILQAPVCRPKWLIEMECVAIR